MNVVSIVLIVVLVGLVSYLLIDTTIYVVKKIKLKKQEKRKNKLDDSNNN